MLRGDRGAPGRDWLRGESKEDTPVSAFGGHYVSGLPVFPDGNRQGAFAAEPGKGEGPEEEAVPACEKVQGGLDPAGERGHGLRGVA